MMSIIALFITECLESNSTDEFYKNLEDFQENISEIKILPKVETT